VPDADADSAISFLGYLYIVSHYTVRLMTPCVWRILCLRKSISLCPTFGNHRIYQLLHAETESAPNVVRLLSAETECPPKVPINLSTFGTETETEAEIRSTSSLNGYFLSTSVRIVTFSVTHRP